jgi:hypothetical protein
MLCFWARQSFMLSPLRFCIILESILKADGTSSSSTQVTEYYLYRAICCHGKVLWKPIQCFVNYIDLRRHEWDRYVPGNVFLWWYVMWRLIWFSLYRRW